MHSAQDDLDDSPINLEQRLPVRQWGLLCCTFSATAEVCVADMRVRRRTVMDPVSRAASGCRVIAFDRPPFGLTERPLTWTGGDANSPYSAQVRRYT